MIPSICSVLPGDSLTLKDVWNGEGVGVCREEGGGGG